MPPKETGPFKIKEKCLVPYTDQLYEAKVVKAEQREGDVWFYLVHYLGWNKEHDEWVEAPGLVKFDPAAIGKEPDTEAKPALAKSASKKRKHPDGSALEDVPVSGGAQVSVVLPPSLKRVLVEAYERVQQGDLCQLPCAPTVTDILHAYVEDARTDKNVTEPGEEVATGLRIYFDKALQQFLLYRQEFEQGEKALAHGKVPSSVYGGEHLLRLFVQLPKLVPLGSVTAEGQAAIEGRIAEVVRYLQKQPRHILLPDTSRV